MAIRPTISEPINAPAVAPGEGFAYRKGDPDATNFFNNWIEVNWRNGFLDERNAYWFKGDEWASRAAVE